MQYEVDKILESLFEGISKTNLITASRKKYQTFKGFIQKKKFIYIFSKNKSKPVFIILKLGQLRKESHSKFSRVEGLNSDINQTTFHFKVFNYFLLKTESFFLSTFFTILPGC